MFKVKGIVIKGKGKGRQLGFPTINISINEKIESGVYNGRICLDGKEYKAGVFITPKGLLEAYIIDFLGDLYGKEMEVVIGEKIRDAQKFFSEEDLKKQIAEDIKSIKIFN